MTQNPCACVVNASTQSKRAETQMVRVLPLQKLVEDHKIVPIDVEPLRIAVTDTSQILMATKQGKLNIYCLSID
jgi:hypothetical protein